MKSVIRFAIIGTFMAAALVSVSAAPKGKGLATAPGQAENFYRGITTLAPVVTTELASSTSEVISSISETSAPVLSVTVSEPVVVATRIIGQSKGNPTGNLQDKTATTTTTESVSTVTTTSVIETTNVYDVTTIIGSHHGAPISSGKALEPVVTLSTEVQVIESTEINVATVSSSTTETVVGDWEAAYSVPSGTK